MRLGCCQKMTMISDVDVALDEEVEPRVVSENLQARRWEEVKTRK